MEGLKMRVAVGIALLLLTAAVAPAAARQPAPVGRTPLQALANCRAVQPDLARLACFDAAAAPLLAAEQAGDLVVVDREQARAARREAFGFNLPSLNLFGREGPDGAEANRVELVLAGASQGPNGRWVFRTENDQVWRQIDSEPLRKVRPGAKAAIRKATLGTFFMNVDGQRAVRVRREQ